MNIGFAFAFAGLTRAILGNPLCLETEKSRKEQMLPKTRYDNTRSVRNGGKEEVEAVMVEDVLEMRGMLRSDRKRHC